MPKPTFLQAVLKKPTRSYADPYHSSPWSDRDPAQSSSYYTSSSSSKYDEQYNQYNHAGPSKPRSRGPSSTISASTMSDVLPNNNISMGSRFPKPARRVVSNVTLRDGQLIHDSPPRSSSSAVGPSRKKTIKASGINRIEEDGRSMSRAGTVKKKKKPKSIVDENDSILSSPTSTTMSLPMPPPIRSRNSETSSSAPSSPVPPLSPVTSTHSEAIRQKPSRPNYSKPPLPLLTPPSSEMSTPNCSTQHMQTISSSSEQTPKLQINQVQAPQVIVRNADSDSDDEVFYTPRTSLEDLQLPTPTTTESDNLTTPKPSNSSIAPPSFNFLPPTPAPIPDPAQSPFHSEPSSSSSSLHPDRPFVSRQSSKIEISPIQTSIEPQIPSGADEDDDVQSASGQAGSDEEKEPERQGRFDRPNNGVWSRPTSAIGRSTPPSLDGYGSRAPSRQSTSRHVSRHSSDEQSPGIRRPSVPASEASFTSAPNRPEGSIRGSGSISGYGKGGWAAAHTARSRPSSPVMFMPAAGDGWADFQPPPPRQSKFTPLPSASLSPTFDRITDGSRLPVSGPSSRASQNDYNGGGGLRPSSRGDSSPSEYSQLSDGLEMPSRSYLKKDHSSHASQSTTVSDGGRQPLKPEPGSLAFPIARVGSLSISHSGTSPSLARPPSRQGSETYPSRPMSPSMDFSRPTSPMMSGRPPSVLSQSTSPMTFNPPSFLNPDLLTILPEMTNEDSDRLYRPSRSESGKVKRNSMQDWASHNPSRRSSMFRAKSEVGHHDDYEDERDVPELPARRSKSVIGFRNHDYTKDRERDRKWEGSSYGDGVLMESNGRAPESVGGYTNLVLPSGAYRPNNPAKSNALDSRILGMPHATMASIVLTTTFSRHSSTPAHLRDQLPPLVDFSSHLKPPTKVGDSQLLVQVYAVAIDQVDVRALDERARWEVGKYVPGRSFVGRALVVGADEKEVVRGDLVIGILDIRKSGALSEYIAVDRRRISRAPFPTHLSLEQLSLLPLQGIAAARAVRTHLIRNSRALILNAHEGVAALVCQEMSRSGVNITAVIPGGDQSHEHHKLCIENGAKGVLMGSPAAVMLSLEEGAWDYVFDTVGGVRVGDAARRLLRDGGRLISTMKSDSSSTSPTTPTLTSRPSGLKSLKAAFGSSNSRRKDSKFVSVEYLPPTGSGEPEVDSSGMDYRDIMEEPCVAIFRPVLHEYINRKNSMMPGGEGERVKTVVNFEKGQEVFRRDWEGVRAVRVIN
ncbi:hypothetical protein I302_105932 [Kwoniella bestiolae CBS 10118]|uniref:Enoyl reductase (ER) domain-containing protein n=1 Tax=Kwoniella bestiolae CBS 10118 TaxID=1296100 RepID=A0A1B9G2J4_9TREE|nr:hypothetical protein I302_05056 [Kwoniella bestiolae CBS 10118]OCF25243.1 hypothetical protein I302_05056 [Kwoniella bestiolae CBS 10118]